LAGRTYSGKTYAGATYAGSTYVASARVPQIRPNPAPPAPPPPVYYKCEPYLTAFIGCGKGNDVKEIIKLQTFLRDYEGEKIAITGVYDDASVAAVKRFQQKYALDILQNSWGLECTTGCVYITTLTKINDIVCQTQTDFKKIPLPNPRPKFFCPGTGYSNSKTKSNCVETAKVIVVNNSTATNAKATVTKVTASVGDYATHMVDKTKGFWRDIITK
jgi:peptidoglycan hydrolase-like protein with peptidoglycan-binding domain